MKTWFFWSLVSVLVCWLGLPALQSRAAERHQARPNIVFILADDLGYGDLGCYGATKVKTPNIDRMAKEGIRFTDAHSPSSVCTPSRYNLLTGRYCWRTWAKTGCVWMNDPLLIEEGRMTLPSLAKSAGYHTGCVGKWHLGFGKPGTPGWDNVLGPDLNGQLRPGPLQVGFDYFFGVPFVGQLPHVFIENGYVVDIESGDPIRLVADPRPAFGTDYLQRPRTENPDLRVTGGRRATYVQEDLAITLTQKAVAYIRENARHPFFLYFAHRNIHAPLCPNARFRGTSEIGMYGDFIHELDWSVGEVLHTLDQLGLAANTLVIFSSDNGAVSAGHRPLAGRVDYKGHKPNGIWRGQKTEVYEGGHRVPLLARWPGHTPAGVSSGQLLALTDMLATFSALLERPLPHDAGEDSVNMLPALLGRDGGAVLRETLVHDSWKGLFAVRQGPWKLILGPGGGGIGWQENQPPGSEPSLQLYNLADDPGETKNLCAEKPEIVARLKARLEKIQKAGRSRP